MADFAFWYDVISNGITLPTNYPIHAGKAQLALKSVIAPYIATRREMRHRVRNSNLTTELLSREKISWLKNVPDLFCCKKILKSFQRFVTIFSKC